MNQQIIEIFLKACQPTVHVVPPALAGGASGSRGVRRAAREDRGGRRPRDRQGQLRGRGRTGGWR